MAVLRVFCLFIEVLTSLLLIGVVLLQKSKSEGLGMAFGAGVGESLFGSRAGNVLTRATVFLGAVFLLNTLVLVRVYSHSAGATTTESSLVDEMPDMPVSPAPVAAPAPTAPDASAPETVVPVTPVPAVPAPEAVPVAPAPVVPAEHEPSQAE